MSYSRRQLYAMGEPTGDSATRRRADGGLILGSGGGGGGSSGNVTQTNTSMTELPEWARGYAKDTLHQASQLTDISKNPYQTYGQNRIAGFSPMQEQAQQGAANMQPNAALGTGMDMATAAGMGALGTNYQGGQFSGGQFNQGAANQYMSPYMQNVVDVQKREAQRQSGMQGTQQQAQAAQAGAFGGGRDAIMRAERERNLGTQMNDIQAMGSQNAFQNAQQQFNADQSRGLQAQQLGEQSRQYGAGLGLQGLQTGLQAAGQMGQLGQAQYGQQMGINQLQNQYGGQQQALAQQGLSQGYQDFLNQQNNPYKQLGFMSDLVRGMPLGQQSTSQIYQAPPSMMQNIGAAGMGLYGAKQLGMFAEGGQVKGYAGGGELNPMDDLNRMTAAVSKLSDEQLQQVVQRPSSAAQKQAAQLELATRRSEKQGLASVYNALPAGAGGGMVAFGKGGIMHFQDEGFVQEPPASALPETMGNSAIQAQLNPLLLKAAQRMANEKEFTADSETEEQGITRNMAMMNRIAGPSSYDESKAQVADLTSQAKDALEQGKGIAALSAMGAILQGPNFMRALGGAGTAFADSYKGALTANQAAKTSIAQMNINLAAGQRAEKLGLIKDAAGSYQAAKKYRLDAFKAQQDANAKTLSALSQAEKAVQPPKPAAAVKPSDMSIYAAATPAQRGLFDAYLAGANPAVAAAGVTQTGTTGRQVPELDLKTQELELAREKARATITEKATQTIDDNIYTFPEYTKALRGKDPQGRTAAQVRQALIEAEISRTPAISSAPAAKPAAAPATRSTAAPAAAPATPKPITELPPGTTYGKVIPGKGTEAILNGKVIGYVN